MEFDPEFDPSQYARLPPNLDLASTLALGRQLVAATPSRPSSGAKRTATALDAANQVLEAAMVSVLRGGPVVSKRPIDQRADRVWVAVEMRLAGWLQLDPQEYPEAAGAAVLHQQLFPDGLRFTQLEYGAQWAEAEARMQLLKKDHQEATLEALCGTAFVVELQKAHAAYGEMVGAKGQKKAAGKGAEPDTNLLRKKTQQAILAHQIQLVAMCMSGDPAEQVAARAALRPIDEYRDKLTPSRPKKEEPPNPPTA